MNKLILCIAALFILFTTACEKNNPTPENPSPLPNPTEIITTAILELEPVDSSFENVAAIWKDEDGDGPLQPVIDTIYLQDGVEYNGTIILLDESKTPTDTISLEVEEEADVHQFFYSILGSLQPKITITKKDLDANQLPLGLKTTLAVAGNTNGTDQLKVILKHYDGINKSIDPTVGDTDIEIILPVMVK